MEEAPAGCGSSLLCTCTHITHIHVHPGPISTKLKQYCTVLYGCTHIAHVCTMSQRRRPAPIARHVVRHFLRMDLDRTSYRKVRFPNFLLSLVIVFFLSLSSLCTLHSLSFSISLHADTKFFYEPELSTSRAHHTSAFSTADPRFCFRSRKRPEYECGCCEISYQFQKLEVLSNKKEGRSTRTVEGTRYRR